MSNATATEIETSTCFWCKDENPEHIHYAVLCRDKDGKLLGRLGSDGYAVKRNIFALILGKARAEEIAAEINEAGEFTAKAIKF